MGVDIFLFLSAIGLSRSIQNNNITTFYKHRINRVVLPYLFIAVPFFIWLDFIQYKDGILQFALNTTTMNYWLTGNHPTWYIALIIVLYLFFPLFYRWDNNTQHISTVLIIILSVLSEYIMYKVGFPLYNTAERALSCIPVFMIGLLFASHVFSNRLIYPWQILMLLFFGIWFFVVISLKPLHVVVMRYLYCPIGISIIVCYTFIRSKINVKALWKPLRWFGAMSLELYIIHVLILRGITVTNAWTLVKPFWWWFIIPTATVPLALFLQRTTNYIIKIK